jgi:alkylation response protein AidB-like acyl-CoA dehydrogenase
MLKIWATETCQRVGELTMEAAEECGGLMGSIPFGDKEFDLLYPFLDARAWTIYGGSNQVQRNILAKGVLNLPS